jgi:hypothetical protein
MARHNQGSRRRIYSAIEAEWPTPLNAWTLSQRTGLSEDWIRHVLMEGRRSGKLERTTRGFYTIPALKATGTAMADMRLENITLVARRHNLGLRGGRDRSHLNSLAIGGRPRQTRLDDLTREARRSRHEVIDREEERTFYGVWAAYIQTFPNGTVEVQIGTRGIPGLRLTDFLGLCGWVAGKYPDIPDDGPDGWHIRNLEMNRDLPGYRLEGAHAFTLRLFRNLWLKLYEKEAGPLRVEFRHANVAIPLKDAAVLFGGLVDALLKLGLIHVDEVGP